jgi:adenylate kinase family enzyme/RimJ/RimL family protein N-acetyltransferase
MITEMNLTLHVPTMDELAYRIYLLADADTMAYNAAWTSDGTGRIVLTPEQAQEWYREMAAQNLYYAYVYADDTPIGEVNIHSSGAIASGAIGIVLEAKHRKRGYAKQALKLLCDKAFFELGFDCLTDDFGAERIAAEKTFASVGFERIAPDRVRLTRERYLQFAALRAMNIIHVLGASGAGTSTLGQALEKSHGYKWLDTDDYFWLPTDPPFTASRSRDERTALLKGAIEANHKCVVTGSLCGWGDVFIPQFDLVLWVDTPTDIRIERLREREYKRFGDRIREGGDMYVDHEKFIEWAKSYDTNEPPQRCRALHDAWVKNVSCPVLKVDGTRPVDDWVWDIMSRA